MWPVDCQWLSTWPPSCRPNSLIANFSSVRSEMGMMWSTIKTSWGLKGAFSLGPIHSRHVLIRMMNGNDLLLAFSKDGY
jgi:hypothetical protein